MQSLAGFRTVWLGLVASALVAVTPAQFGGVASADTVDIWSLPSRGSNSINGVNVAVSTSPAWYTPPVGSGYEWISYSDTGCNFFVVATGRCAPGPDNPAGGSVTGSPTAIFYQTFTLTDPGSGNLDVWADDTATVWLDSGTVSSGDGSSGGTMEWLANGNLGPNCANAPIGCLASTGASIPLNLAAGTYTLVFDTYQLVGDTPFGVMYDGEITTSGSGPQSPEPASYMLMGLGLAGLGAFFWRRQHQTRG
jgi:hypothetical protein